MKKALLSVLGFVFAFNSFSGVAQPTSCALAGGAPTPVAPVSVVCANNFNANDLAITSYSSQGSLNIIQVVVSQLQPNDSSLIVGLSDDGAFDFTTANAGAALAYGDYQFRIFACNQDELNVLADQLNPLSPLLCYCPSTMPFDANGNARLIDLFSTLALVFPGLTVEDVEYAICSFLPTLGASLPYGLSDPYTVTWQADGCLSGINDAQANAINVSTNNSTAVVSLSNSAATTVGIFDLNGKALAMQTVNGTATFDISAYPAGMYVVRANNGATTTTTKFVK
ncbi:MAG: T9SS type A sorting domain-containing protein [Sphingobacteriales bacterium]|jgi:hypothetical protein|nr:T9SS type A sorting domain-containing protein [Sphingobacteriales bacterium]